jgi:putative protease
MRNIELLSPAGNFDCLKAAVSNGADAVYLGGKNFSARAFANNFDEQQLIEAVRYAHLHDVRVFVTLNTLLTEKEFDNAVKMADFYYRNNVDALLIQDLGLYDFLKQKYPDFELHCSTQMHVHNLEGVKTAKQLGFKRVVVARESDLDFIRQACMQGIEIETFVHGAICVSYSGECLMSSATKNRSANKGMCAQCCRLRYELYEEKGNKIKTDTDYLLSPKDMFLLNDIPDLIDAGVSSFKIEGRMKSAAYVGYVTRMYRKAIDSYLNSQEYEISDQELRNLKVLFNRNFTDDLLHGRKGLFGQMTPNHQGIEIGEVLYCRKGKAYLSLKEGLSQFDGIRIGDFGCIVNRLYQDGMLVSSVRAGQTAAIDCDDNLKGKVYKTLDHVLEESILKTEEKKIPLDMEISVCASQNVSVKLHSGEYSYSYRSDIIAQDALKAPLSRDSIIRQFSKLSDSVYELRNITVDTDQAFLPIRDLNQIRRDAIDAFNEFRLNSFHRETIKAEYPVSSIRDIDYPVKAVQINDVMKINDEDYPINYVINKDSVYSQSENAVICEFGGLLKDYSKKIAYYTLNCCNSHTYEFFRKLGFSYVVLSSELHDNEIKDLISAYESRNKERIRPFVLTSGDRILMYLNADPFDSYTEKGKTYYLKDRDNRYDIRKHKGITELIQRDFVNEIDTEDIVPLTVTLD